MQASEVVVRVRGSKSHAHRMLGIILDALYENLAKVSRIEWESYVTAVRLAACVCIADCPGRE